MSGREAGFLEPCGTSSAYRRHYRRGTKPCDRCKRAERVRLAAKWAADIEAGTVVLAVHKDHGGRAMCGLRGANRLAGPGEEVTCGRCQMITAQTGRAA